MNSKDHIKPGMKVLVKGFEPEGSISMIVAVGHYPSLWLPEGKTQWGATFAFDAMVINPDYESGLVDFPKEIPGQMISDPQQEESFSFNKKTQQWELRLI